MRLVELIVGARVDEQGAAGDRDLDGAGAERRRGTELLDQRAPVEVDDVFDVGRAVPERRNRVGGELVGVGELDRVVVRELEADR